MDKKTHTHTHNREQPGSWRTMDTVAIPGELNQHLGTCPTLLNCVFTIPAQQGFIIAADL